MRGCRFLKLFALVHTSLPRKKSGLPFFKLFALVHTSLQKKKSGISNFGDEKSCFGHFFACKKSNINGFVPRGHDFQIPREKPCRMMVSMIQRDRFWTISPRTSKRFFCRVASGPGHQSASKGNIQISPYVSTKPIIMSKGPDVGPTSSL